MMDWLLPCEWRCRASCGLDARLHGSRLVDRDTALEQARAGGPVRPLPGSFVRLFADRKDFVQGEVEGDA
jgi:hypothetical protein